MSRTVLLVDDSATMRSLLKVHLFQLHLEYIEAVDGGEALELARLVKPSVIIADERMPRIDGPTFCELLHADPSVAHIPVVLLSASVGETMAEQARRVGAARSLGKPIDGDALVSAVAELLGD